MHAAADAFGAVGADGVPGVGAAVVAVAVGGAVARIRAAYLRAGEAHHQGGYKQDYGYHPHKGTEQTCLVNLNSQDAVSSLAPT